MEIEAYGDYDTMIIDNILVCSHWIGYQVEPVSENNISHLGKSCPMQGWGDIKSAVSLLHTNANAGMETWYLHKILPENGDQLKRVTQVASKGIKLMGTQASGEVKVEASWGDKEGTKVSVGASGKVSDDKGNYVKAEIKQDNNGNGSASVSAGAKKDK